jgi:hypothetical protein
MTKAAALAGATWLAGAIVALSAQTARTGTATLSGRVVDRADERAPLARARVLLYMSPTLGDPIRETFTSTDGRYEFPQLAAGTYEIRAMMPGWLSARYGQKKPDSTGTPVVVADRAALSNLTIRMWRGSVITGVVRGQHGAPLIREHVGLFRLRYRPDGRYLDFAEEARTDDRGLYRFFDLSPGEYVVRVSPGVDRIFGTTRATLDGVQPPQADGYPVTFFPAASSPGQATPIVLGLAEERAGVDFSLPVVPMFTVRGRVLGPNGPVSNVQLRRLDDDGLLRGDESLEAAVGVDGRFVITNVTGPLTVLARAYPVRRQSAESESAGTLWGMARVPVGGADVTDVTIALQPGVNVSGVIKFEGQAPPPDLANRRLSMAVQPAGPGGLTEGEILTSTVDANGRFSIGGVPPGTFHIVPVNLPPPWSHLSSTYLGRDMTSAALEVSTEDRIGIVVTMTDRPASLAGSVRAPAGDDVTDYTVVAFPADPQARAARTRAVYAVRVSTAGQFTMPRVFPGDYLLAVTNDIETDSWFDPRVMEQLAVAGVRVSVSAGEAKVQHLQVGR